MGTYTYTEATFPNLVLKEIRRAREIHGPVTGLHDGYAKILEELDEFWDEVRKKDRDLDPNKVVAELVQISAMAQRTAEDVMFQRHPHTVLGGWQ